MTLTTGISTSISRLYAMQLAATPGTTAATSDDSPAGYAPPFWNNFVRSIQMVQELGTYTYVFEVTIRAVLIAGTSWQDVNGEMERLIQQEYAPNFITYFMQRRMLQNSASETPPPHLNVPGARLGQGGGYGLNQAQGYVGFEIPIILPFVVEIEELY